ncbi:MAG: IclR family transcriptional regulator, partial [Mobilicoccus sp.]|nr:IclR family transcriptional regulator [Mobilicoccus sp.]
MCPAERNAAGVLDRLSAILESFDDSHQRLSLSELARRSGLPKSTTHRLVADLLRLELLEHLDGRLQLGMRIFELGELVPRRRGLVDAAAPFMTDLRSATGQTVHLAVLDDHEVVYLHIVAGTGAKRLPSRVGGRLPCHATGVGKAILAFSPSELVAAVLEAPLAKLSPYTIVRPAVLARELGTIHRSGISLDREESSVGTSCVAAPVLGPDGLALAAISVS